MTPKRIQLSRRRGWRKPSNTVVVSRPTRWGNPFPAGDRTVEARATATKLFTDLLTRRGSIGRPDEPRYPSDEEIRQHLAGRNLACWCPMPGPGQRDFCHAAVLLDRANPSEER